jgi:acetyl-CoA/propionyl-CoA carboxylase, biotin carboxylase, biotin carboxyl carrier protein
MAMFSKVLVANRGEIAVRVMRTLRAMGVASVAVYSEADADALHVAAADEAVLIGPAPARLSYLDVGKVVQAAVSAGADAVHPGYGFLSENADFAEACERVGLVFVGPTVESIRLMGDKRAAKDAVAALGVRVVPGFHGVGADEARFAAEAAAIGFPVIVKPSAGGGGKGMHVVDSVGAVPAALAAAKREALSAFGDDALLLEKYVARARHVEVQVLGDGSGAAVHLGDRDCSLQRRHQKVIEEAPAPFLPDDVRLRMHADATAIARAVAYRGVGTVEFVVDASDPSTYYFLEMNTRLQVEHPVTELVTGLDLVELQLRVAAGEPMPVAQADLGVHGHAVEARVYAEDGHRGFLPSSGALLDLRLPTGVRVDSGVRAGDVVGTTYDPLLFKVIASGADRLGALDALDAALSEITVLGVSHNVGVLRELLASPAVRAGAMTTSLIGDLRLGSTPTESDAHRCAAAALVLADRRQRQNGTSAWTRTPGWRVGEPAPLRASLLDENGVRVTVATWGLVEDCQVAVDGAEPVGASLRAAPTGGPAALRVTYDGVTREYVAAVDRARSQPTVWLGAGGDSWWYREQVRDRLRRADDSDAEGAAAELRSPMPGAVVLLAASVGDEVREGEVVAVVEAMKMEYPLVSPFNGTLADVSVSFGSQVERDQLIAVVRAKESQ